MTVREKVRAMNEGKVVEAPLSQKIKDALRYCDSVAELEIAIAPLLPEIEKCAFEEKEIFRSWYRLRRNELEGPSPA